MKIKYEFVDGTKEIEVDEEIYKASEEINEQIKRNDRRETRRHISTNKGDYEYEQADESADIEQQIIEKEELDHRRKQLEKLNNLLPQLNTEQQKLIRSVFFIGIPLKELAKQHGTSYQAIQNRLKKILAKLRKNF